MYSAEIFVRKLKALVRRHNARTIRMDVETKACATAVTVEITIGADIILSILR